MNYKNYPRNTQYKLDATECETAVKWSHPLFIELYELAVIIGYAYATPRLYARVKQPPPPQPPPLPTDSQRARECD